MEKEDKELEKDNKLSENSENSIDGNEAHNFIVEKIKARPINKKLLTRKMLLTASMAVVFGTIACLSFLLLEPLFEKMISRGAKDETVLTQVKLTEVEYEEDTNIDAVIDTSTYDDSQSDTEKIIIDGTDSNADVNGEMISEAISIEETPIENLNLEDNVSSNTVSNNIVVQEVNKEIGLDDYQILYRKLYSMGKEAAKSVVIVTGAGKSQDIFNDEFVNTSRTTGLIVAENGKELLILADATDMPSDNITVTFCDGYIMEAVEKAKDKETGLAIYGVSLYSLPSNTRDASKIATLGTSNSSLLLGTPVIAIGDPMNSGNSVCYGNISSMDNKLYATDIAYQLMSTDIYGSKKANGILVNVKGQVIGIICQHHNSDDMKNIVTAFGISGIKNLIEDMSNDRERVYLGLNVKDISNETRLSLNIPNGVYVSKVELDSPAMNVGIVPGDIICSIDDKDISTLTEYTSMLRNYNNNANAVIGVMRLSGNEYKKTEIQVKLVTR